MLEKFFCKKVLIINVFIQMLWVNMGDLCRFFGEKSLKVAMSHHLIARTNSCKGDFRTALQNERDAWDIYRQIVRDNSDFFASFE